MKRWLSSMSLTISIVFCLVSPSWAVSLSLSPSTQNINPTQMGTVDLVVADLGNFVAPSLGAFLVEITFDDSLLAFDSVSYGPSLGDPFDTIILTTPGAGTVSLDEFSFLFDFELDALQPDTFSLATLTFTGLAPGSSALGFGTIDLSDALGSTIVPSSLDTASITVNDPQVPPIPEPATFILMATGLAGIAAWKLKQGRKNKQIA